ncbi:hypothetical protein Vi05172_g6922 [Venturia inaequalis]|nr:hypothetical protein Vi05172_g6922 [Venturia inaequalis]
MAFNTSASSFALPPLPEYQLKPLPDLISWCPDYALTLALPILAYWIVSLFFHLIDTYDLFPQYRLHTPAELVTRNHASRVDVFRDVVLQQIIQTIFGLALTVFDPEPTFGKESYDVAVWAQRIRIAERAVPAILAGLGLNAVGMAKNLASFSPTIAAVLAGGHYPSLQQVVTINGEALSVPAFATWEVIAAKAIYYWLIPALQFGVGTLVVDSWQYFWHRAMHMNKWLYTTFHSRHHRLYVPYAYGALYNHPVEGFLLDTLGTGLAYLVVGMSVRQSMWFFTCSTIKTVDDHCGYRLPWDPLQHITSNNAEYHDIHHQSWGIKTNFSQPFFTFWDRFLGTMWTGGDVSARYARSKNAAEAKYNRSHPMPGSVAVEPEKPTESTAPYEEPDHLQANELASLPPRTPQGKARAQAVAGRQQVLDDKEGGGAQVLAEEADEERRAQSALRRSTRKKSSISSEAAMKGLKDRVSGSLPTGVPRVDSRR